LLFETFALSEFERDVLVLCAGAQLGDTLVPACARACGMPAAAQPTLAMAAALFGAGPALADWTRGRLRHFRIVVSDPHEPFLTAALRVDDAMMSFLLGGTPIDDRVGALTEPLAGPPQLPASQEQIAARIAAALGRAGGDTTVAQLSGAGHAVMRAVAASAAANARLHLHALRAANVPATPAERALICRLWERQAALAPLLLLLELDGERDDETRAALALAESLAAPLIIASREAAPLRRPALRFEISPPCAGEQAELWRRALPAELACTAEEVEQVAAQFRTGWDTAEAASAVLRAEIADGTLSGTPGAALWRAFRIASRRNLDGLATRISSPVSWDDLVLAPPIKASLRDISAHLRHRVRVYEHWGLARAGERGLGVSALFHGDSGTGKTLAAEVIANELALDLYRIDLSQVVSKYIGETEKNLRRIFDAAEESGAILLFDEADALFGKRSEVKDSHDRYANIEVSYLLSRIESYRGLAILTTNFRQALDPAFLRRIRFVVQFPFPEVAERESIWRRAFPADAPTSGLDPAKLARLRVTGGSIRNIALGAAFLAADEAAPIAGRHVLRAVTTEYRKLELVLGDAEIRGLA
jgi:hypothetical protein